MKTSSNIARIAGLALASAASLCAAADAAAPGKSRQNEDGVAYEVNAAHTGNIAFAAGFSAPLTKLWTYNTGESLYYPLIAEDRVYVVADGNDLFALDIANGSELWEHLLGGSENAGAYDAGRLFFFNASGQMTALKASSGNQEWSVPAGGEYTGSTPVASHGLVYIAGEGLTALDENTGALVWSQEVEATSGSAALGDGGVYAAGPCQYYKFAPSNGATLWHDSDGCDGGGGSVPSYFQKQVYLVDWAEGNFVLNAATGAADGTFVGSTTPTMFTIGKRGYGLSITDGKLFCYDIKTGNVRWSFANNALVGQPIVVNGQPIVGTSSGAIYMLDGSTGAQLWTDTVGQSISNLSAGDGVLVVSAGTSVTVYAPQ